MGEAGSSKKVCKEENCQAEGNFGGYCASCAAKRANSIRWSQKKRAKRPRMTRRRQEATPGPDPDREAAITVDFGGHEKLLEQLRELAVAEIRPLNHQVIYLLKRAMQGTGDAS